jgi:hypothetical protein
MSSFYKEQLLTGLEMNIKEPVNNSKDYRYYHCYLDWNGLKCKKVEGPYILPDKDNTKLLFVRSYFPERFDGRILKYKWLPDNVFIEK